MFLFKFWGHSQARNSFPNVWVWMIWLETAQLLTSPLTACYLLNFLKAMVATFSRVYLDLWKPKTQPPYMYLYRLLQNRRTLFSMKKLKLGATSLTDTETIRSLTHTVLGTCTSRDALNRKRLIQNDLSNLGGSTVWNCSQFLSKSVWELVLHVQCLALTRNVS